MPKLFLLALLVFLSSELQGLIVNRLNGGGSITYVDFSIPGMVIPLELVRTYNSITALNEASGWQGAFGWGWTSPFETTLTTTPERHVVLRDGGTGNALLFKPEKEDPKVKQAFFENVKRAYFESNQGRKLTPAELSKLALPQKMLARLKTDPQYRVEVAAKFNIKGAIPKGELLISSEYGYQTILFKDNQWVRERDGVTQIFDNEGRLIRQVDKNGFYFDFKYSPVQKHQLAEMVSQDRTASLKFTWRQERITEVTDNQNHHSRYAYDPSGNLVQVTDSNSQTYLYRYESKKFPHLLTRIDYQTESAGKEKIFREIRYDENGLVVLHRDKDGSETQYVYGKSSQDPENNFSTKTIRKAKGSTEELFEEFFIRNRPDGTKYLYKQETKQGGVSTVTLFTTCCGKPTQTIRNGEVTNFKYYDNGLLAEKIGPKEEIQIEYDPRFKKVTKVNQNGFVSKYEYDNRGNLIKAYNTKNQRVVLKYDKFGRIVEMTDPEGKNISFKYGDRGKPVLIREKGVGTIRIDYDKEGRIQRTETVVSKEGERKPSEAKSQEVVRQIMKSFQSLLDILRPAGANLGTT